MDKDFNRKVKQKKIRAAIIAVLLIAVAAWIIMNTTVDKSDYSKSLAEEINTAETLLKDNADNQGNGEGQYAPYTMMSFESELKAAKGVYESKDSQYTDKKDAYEELKDAVKAFKSDVNSDVISQQHVEDMIKSDAVEEYAVEINDGKKINYTMKASAVKTPKDINLMAREQGPYYDGIVGMLDTLSVEGQIISFYHDGSLGGEIDASVDLAEASDKCHVYRIDTEKNQMQYLAETPADEGKSDFVISQGGDYVILKEKLSEEKTKKAAEEIAKAVEDVKEEGSSNSGGAVSSGDGSGSSSSGGSSSESSGGSQSGADGSTSGGGSAPSDEITVTLEVRNDTYDGAQMGAIIPATTVTLKKGASAYDALVKVCRNAGVNLNSTYDPIYGTYYVVGIDYLDEKAAGRNSGWLYYVNGSSPGYGSSGYVLSGGESISFRYTVNG